MSKATKITSYFNQSHAFKAKLKAEASRTKVSKETLDTIVPTRWSSVASCLQSFVLLRTALTTVVTIEKEKLPQKIVNIVSHRTFFTDIENLYKIMRPLAYAMSLIQSRSTTLADCYLILSYLQLVVSSFVINADMRMFGRYVSKVVNKRLREFQNDYYLSCFYLHPKYRGAGLLTNSRATVFRTIAEYSKLIGNNASTTKNVISALQRFEISAGSYSLMYAKGEQPVFFFLDRNRASRSHDQLGDTPTAWWYMVKDQTHGDCLQKIALRLLSITPHSVMPERLFSILDWQHSKRRNRLNPFTLESIAKIHTYYSNQSALHAIDTTSMEEALATELEVENAGDADSDDPVENANTLLHEMRENQEVLRVFSDSEAIDEEASVEENDLLQLDRSINTMDHALHAILIDVGLLDDHESLINDDETQETEQQQEENNKDYDVDELLANAIGF